MLGTSQYTVIPLIQVASITGVWGVTFIVMLANAVVAWYVSGRMRQARRGGRRQWPWRPSWPSRSAGGRSTSGQAARAAASAAGARRTVRIALVQQDTDPRKDDYQATFETLKRLTAQALPRRPDLVAWSETAFVPNIRRWSKEDPAKYPLAALVRDFLTYQKSITSGFSPATMTTSS